MAETTEFAAGPRADASGVQRASRIVLAGVATVGAVLSYTSLYQAASQTFGPILAAGFPLLVDALILGASLAYIASCRAGHPRIGWRWIAHGGVAGTVALNALAAPELADVPWHIAAPLVWSVLVEMVARDATFAGTPAPRPRIPTLLWITAPGESASTALRLARLQAHRQARLDVGVHAAATEALRLALPGRHARRVRRILQRQLRAGSLAPAAVLDRALDLLTTVPADSPRGVLRDVLATVSPSARHPLCGPDGSASGIATLSNTVSGKTRRDAIRMALEISGATSARGVMEWMAEHGRPASRSEVYAVMRERTVATEA